MFEFSTIDGGQLLLFSKVSRIKISYSKTIGIIHIKGIPGKILTRANI